MSIEQLSDEPLLICSVVIEAFPFTSSCMVTGCVTTVGVIESSTVTIAVAIALFPLTSVTVSVTI